MLGSAVDPDHRGGNRWYHTVVTEESAKAVVSVLALRIQGVMNEIGWAVTKLKEHKTTARRPPSGLPLPVTFQTSTSLLG